jgi:hypothetical protein
MKIISEKMQNIKKNEWTAADVKEAILIFTLAVVNFAAGYLLASAQTAAMVTNAN